MEGWDEHDARNGLLIVDEASMVPTVTLDQLTRVAAAYGTRVTLIGDLRADVGPRSRRPVHDLARHRATVHLTNVRRFHAEWETRRQQTAPSTRPHNRGHLPRARPHPRCTVDGAVDQVVAAWPAMSATG